MDIAAVEGIPVNIPVDIAVDIPVDSAVIDSILLSSEEVEELKVIILDAEEDIEEEIEELKVVIFEDMIPDLVVVLLISFLFTIISPYYSSTAFIGHLSYDPMYNII